MHTEVHPSINNGVVARCARYPCLYWTRRSFLHARDVDLLKKELTLKSSLLIAQALRLMALVVPCAMTHVLPLGIGALGDEQA